MNNSPSFAPGKRLRVWQYNCSKDRAVMLDLQRRLDAGDIDVVLLQEPYWFKGQTRGLSSQYRLHDGTPPDPRGPRVSVVVCNPDIHSASVVELETDVGICVKLTGWFGTLHIVSLYCTFGGRMEDHVDYLGRVIDVIGNARLIVGADANACCLDWNSKFTQERKNSVKVERGEVLNEFMRSHGMTVLNEFTRGYTYNSRNGSCSDIDITFRSGVWHGLKIMWSLLEEGVSDHNILQTDILSDTGDLRRGRNHSPTRSSTRTFMAIGTRWRKSVVYWPLYESMIKDRLDEGGYDIEDAENSEETLAVITKVTILVNDELLGRVKGVGRQKTQWWSEDLTQLKKLVKSARNNLARSRRSNKDIVGALRDWRRKVAEYKRELTLAKRRSWREFVVANTDANPWDVVYKICRNKSSRAPIGALRVGDRYTDGWEESIEVLLDKFFPPPRGESSAQSDSTYRVTVTPEQVEAAIWSIKSSKAPGLDGFTGRMARSLWRAIPEWMTQLYTQCLAERKFPEVWRTANLAIILKGAGKDVASVSSYRPISLIPILGKVMERLMVNNLQLALEKERVSTAQYGFIQGKSTEHAWGKVKEIMAGSTSKYMLAVFVDFTGAFDNLCWKSVLGRIGELEDVDLELWKSYFSNRRVVVQDGEKYVWRDVRRGCPQGSICGPYIWNMMMNKLLLDLEDQQYKVVAYADDILLLIEADSLKGAGRVASAALRIVCEWGSDTGVSLSPEKTNCMLLRGKTMNAHHIRVVNPDGKVIDYVKKTKYLGVVVGEGMSFLPHLVDMEPRVKGVIHPLKRVLRKEWGVSDKVAMVWFLGLLQAIVLYGCTAWGTELTNTMARNRLLRIQKMCLMACTRVYRTNAVSSLQILRGSPPWDLEVERRSAMFKYKNGNIVPDGPVMDGMDHKAVAEILHNSMMTEWQYRWDNDSTGRMLYKFCKDVEFSGTFRAVDITWSLGMLLTGHGDLNGYMHQIRAGDSSLCECAVDREDSIHMLLFCDNYADLRTKLGTVTGISLNNEGNLTKFTESINCLGKLSRFASDAFSRRRLIAEA